MIFLPALKMAISSGCRARFELQASQFAESQKCRPRGTRPIGISYMERDQGQNFEDQGLVEAPASFSTVSQIGTTISVLISLIGLNSRLCGYGGAADKIEFSRHKEMTMMHS